jgi:hypothetical protein
MSAKRRLQIGELVRIDSGTEDEAMPPERIGILIERADTKPRTQSWKVLFVNGQVLKFHECFILRIENDD